MPQILDVYFSRGPKGFIVYIAPAVLLAIVGLLTGLLAHACR
jgi:hypothetical protein